MNIYLCPIYDSENNEIWIEEIKASSFSKALEKLSERFEIDLVENQEEFEKEMSQNNYIVGEIVDIEEF